MPINYEKYPKPERVRHHMSANVYFPFDERNPRPEYYPPVIEELDWKDYFADARGPDSLDIGCGMGRFLLDYAFENKNENVLGLEIRREPVNWINTVIEGEGMGNAAALRYSLANGMPFIASDSISKIFYFFPDPWYKKRQQKRRVFSVEFLEHCHRVLASDGQIFIQTDVAEVHAFHKEVIEEWNNKSNKQNKSKFISTEMFKSRDGQWQLPETDQEQIAMRAEYEVHRLILRLDT